jgi:tRNA (adenine57-N1/adenine58-N1)-methyltransferase
MKKNELVMLLGRKNYLVKVGNEKFHTEFGIIDLSELLKKKFGGKIKSHSGKEFMIVKPTLTDVLMKKAKRLPQIVTPHDASLILANTGIATDSLIIDAGSGSGFLSIFLAYYCSKGKVITYERNKRFAEVAKHNIKLVGLKNIRIKEKDILNGIDEKNVDLITLDMKDAEKVIKNSYKALKIGGWAMVYSPYIEQVKGIVDEFEKAGFTNIKTIENIKREWQVSEFTRPHTLGVMHTGWLTFGRKM